jgi:hypothetical protein
MRNLCKGFSSKGSTLRRKRQEIQQEKKEVEMTESR